MSNTEWKTAKLGDVCDLVAGYAFKSADFGDFESKVIKITHITPPRVDDVSLAGVDISKYDRQKLEKYIVRDGDYVFAMTGATIGKIGRLYKGSAYINQRVLTFRNKPFLIDKDFLYFILQKEDFAKYVYNHIDSESAQPNISANTVAKYEFQLPPLAEQQRIASILSSLDDKIELNNKINRNLEEQAQALFKNWFVDFAPFGGNMPEDWKEESLADLCGSISKVHKFDKKDLIFLNTGDVDHGQYLHRTYSLVKDMPGQAKKSIQKNDILYSEIRPANGHYAYVNFNAEDYVVSTKLMVIRAKEISSYRLYNYLTNPDVIAELQTEADARSGTFPQIRFENIQRLSMVIGSKEVETRFSKLLENLYKQIFANIEENQKLIDLRDTLLPKLISGEEI